MPDDKKYIEEIVKKNPNYKAFFDQHPIPDNVDTTGTVRKLEKVVHVYNGNDVAETPNGRMLTEKGYSFKKVYHDGTSEPITESQYQTLKGFNKLPPHIKDKYVESYDPEKLDPENKKIALAHQEMVKKANSGNTEQEEMNKYGVQYPRKQKLDTYGSVNNKDLYNEISEDPQTLGASYFDVIMKKNNGKATTESSDYLKNWNAKFAKDVGFAYDPNTSGGLHPIPSDSPLFDKIMKDSMSHWNEKMEGAKNKPVESRLYSGGSAGVK